MRRTGPSIAPPPLRAGDTIAVVAPAGPIEADALVDGVKEIERLGFKARFDPTIFERSGYTAGNDARRALELVQAFLDPDVKAVWAARGGYGVMRILPMLARELAEAEPKYFVGYSDLTAMHLWIRRELGWISLHGPMVARELAEGSQAYDVTSLIGALTDLHSVGLVASGEECRTLHAGDGQRVSGPLVGGCLSIVAALVGTPWSLDASGCILFLEDNPSQAYVIDRLIQQLRLAGVFQGVRGLLFGEMSLLRGESAVDVSVDELLRECTSDLGIPVVAGVRSGHCLGPGVTLPLGVGVSLDPVGCTLRVARASTR